MNSQGECSILNKYATSIHSSERTYHITRLAAYIMCFKISGHGSSIKYDHRYIFERKVFSVSLRYIILKRFKIKELITEQNVSFELGIFYHEKNSLFFDN